MGSRRLYNSTLDQANVSIPEGVSTVGEYAFGGCSMITNAEASILTALAPTTFDQTVKVSVDTDAIVSNDNLIASLATNEAFVTALASKITSSQPDNYGIATKSDVSGAISNATTQAIAHVQSSPNDYSLYSEEQYTSNYNTGIAAGTSLVMANPASYNLYTSNSIMDLRMGGVMLQKQGSNAVVTFQPQTTTDLATQPFTNSGAPLTNIISMPGSKGFIRINAKP
jgi:hypothetical protein